MQRMSAAQRERVAWWVRDMIETSGHSQREVAGALSYPPETVWRWCAGRRLPHEDDLRLLCKFLGLEFAVEWERLHAGMPA